MYKFTGRAEKALEIANSIAQEFGHNYVGTEHILYGLAKEGSGVASKVLENQGVTPEAITEEMEMLIGREEGGVTQTVGFTPRTKRVIESAYHESRRLRNRLHRNRTPINRNNERRRQCSCSYNIRPRCKPKQTI